MFIIPYKEINYIIDKYGDITYKNRSIIIESLKNILSLYVGNQIVKYYDEHPDLKYKHYIFQYDYFDKLQTIILKASIPEEAYYLLLINNDDILEWFYQSELERFHYNGNDKFMRPCIDDVNDKYIILFNPIVEKYLKSDGFTFEEFTSYYSFNKK
jgi:hypothetical protein